MLLIQNKYVLGNFVIYDETVESGATTNEQQLNIQVQKRKKKYFLKFCLSYCNLDLNKYAVIIQNI